jgi:hypothetical protein
MGAGKPCSAILLESRWLIFKVVFKNCIFKKYLMKGNAQDIRAWGSKKQNITIIY